MRQPIECPHGTYPENFIGRGVLVAASRLLRHCCFLRAVFAPVQRRQNAIAREKRAKELTDRIGTNLGSLQLNLSNLLVYAREAARE